MTQAEVIQHQLRVASGRLQKLGVAAQETQGVERESDLHAAIYQECRRRGWIALHGAMSERSHRTLGEPDFVILADCRRVYFIECKTRTGKLSPDQQSMRHHAEKLGHVVHVVRSMADFLEIIAQPPKP